MVRCVSECVQTMLLISDDYHRRLCLYACTHCGPYFQKSILLIVCYVCRRTYIEAFVHTSSSSVMSIGVLTLKLSSILLHRLLCLFAYLHWSFRPYFVIVCYVCRRTYIEAFVHTSSSSVMSIGVLTLQLIIVCYPCMCTYTAAYVHTSLSFVMSVCVHTLQLMSILLHRPVCLYAYINCSLYPYFILVCYVCMCTYTAAYVHTSSSFVSTLHHRLICLYVYLHCSLCPHFIIVCYVCMRTYTAAYVHTSLSFAMSVCVLTLQPMSTLHHRPVCLCVYRLKVPMQRLKTKPAEAPVNLDQVQDMQDPLDWLAKYCIIKSVQTCCSNFLCMAGQILHYQVSADLLF